MNKVLKLTLCTLLLPVPVMAATFLDGAYGEKEGCLYATTGESSGADVFFLLNDEGITTSTSFCAFSGEPQKTANGFRVLTQCESEGETGEKEMVDLNRTTAGYKIIFKDGNSWGPLSKCQ